MNRFLKIFLILNLILSSSVTAKDRITDLLLKYKSANEIEKINISLELANLNAETNPKLAIKFSIEACNLSIKFNDYYSKAMAYTLIGEGYRDLGDNDSAMLNFQRAYQVFNDIKYYSGIQRNLNNIGIMYRYQGDYKTALEYHLKAYEI